MIRREPGESLAPDRRSIAHLRELINARCGIYYPESQDDLLADKVSARVIELGFTSFAEYYRHVRYDGTADSEWPQLIEALTVHETYFMREMEQLRAFAEIVAPKIVAGRPSPRLTVWSAACATGEEAYSLAMLLLDRGLADCATIVATDISERALARAKRATYGDRSLRAMSPALVSRHLHREGNGWTVDPRVRDRVSFRQMNLLDAGQMSAVRGVDVVFCRNVFIYFDPDSIQKVVAHFHAALNPGGYLFVGVAESLLRLTSAFELVEIGGAFAYRKR